MVQLSHQYMTTRKTIALTRWAFVGKVTSLFFNILLRFVIAFLPWSKRLLVSWLQSPSPVIFGAEKNKVWHCFHCFPIYFPWWLNEIMYVLASIWMQVILFQSLTLVLEHIQKLKGIWWLPSLTIYLPHSLQCLFLLCTLPHQQIHVYVILLKFEVKNIKSVTISIFSPPICHEVMGPDAMILVFWMLSFKPAFSLFHQETL